MGQFELGGQRFISLDGVPDPPSSELEIVVRPGVDDVAIWRTGRRGKPFTARSRVDCRDIAHAHELVRTYKDLVATGPVSITWKDEVQTEQVVVLMVKPVVLREITGAVGGLNAPSEAWLECDWDLLFVLPVSGGA